MAYTMDDVEIEMGGLTYYCKGQVEFDYEGGDPGDFHTPPVASSAEDINIILDESHDEDGNEVTDKKTLEDIRKALEAHYEKNTKVLTDDWEETAMEIAASNRYDEYIERMNSEY